MKSKDDIYMFSVITVIHASIVINASVMSFVLYHHKKKKIQLELTDKSMVE